MDIWHWNIPSTITINKETFEEKYRILFENMGKSNGSNIAVLMRESKFIIDKTPAYVRVLPQIYDLIPKSVPIIIILKHLWEYYYAISQRNAFLNPISVKMTLNTLKWIKNTKPKNVYVFNQKNINIKRLETIVKTSHNIDFHNYIDKINTAKHACVSHTIKWKQKELPKNNLPRELQILEKEFNELIDVLELIPLS